MKRFNVFIVGLVCGMLIITVWNKMTAYPREANTPVTKVTIDLEKSFKKNGLAQKGRPQVWVISKDETDDGQEIWALIGGDREEMEEFLRDQEKKYPDESL